MTWLSLASRFAASEAQRSNFDQQYLRLNRVASAGTDIVAEAAATEDAVSNKTYDDWVMKFDLADSDAKATMINDLVAKAVDCEDLVPADGDSSAPAQ